MTSTKATQAAALKTTRRCLKSGLVAALMLTVAPAALHAEESNAELAKEIAELKAQIRSMKGAISATRTEARRARRTTVVAAPVVPPPAFAAIPPGATPVYATADKKMIFGSLTITPGGFFAMESANRTRAEGAGLTSGFGNIPTNSNVLAHYGESRFEARQTRPALLIEAPVAKNFLVSGYAEMDFLGVGTTSNFNQTNSYVPRVRHLYATLDANDYGFHVLAGQEWSLIVLNSKGITPRNEVTPPQIDPAYLPGFEYARVPQIRITKDFDKRLWLSLSAESSQTANINNCAATQPAAGFGTSTLYNGIAASNCNYSSAQPNFGGSAAQAYSLNRFPDAVAKAAYEARFADRDIHVEGYGLIRDLYNNVNYGAANAVNGYPYSTNRDTTGYGFGAGLIAPILPKRLDFQIQGLIGRGIGRYASTNGIPDATVSPNGQLVSVGAASALGGLILHATPSIDIYTFAGFEQVNRQYFNNGAGGFVGYGAPGGVNNTGCNAEGGTCQGATKRLWSATLGAWDKLYKGTFGEVRVGVQYTYIQRQLFGGTANANGVATAANPYTSARANDNTVFTSLRYYPFQ